MKLLLLMLMVVVVQEGLLAVPPPGLAAPLGILVAVVAVGTLRQEEQKSTFYCTILFESWALSVFVNFFNNKK